MYQQGRYEEAARQLDKLTKSLQPSTDVYFCAIDCAIKLNRLQQALRYTEQAIARFGAKYPYALLQVQLLGRLGNTNKSIELLNKLTKSYPDSTLPRKMLSELYNARGAEYFRAEKYAEAKADMRSAIQADGQNTEAKKNLALVYLQLKQYSEALPLAKELYRKQAKDGVAQQLYLEVLVKLEKYEEALSVAEEAARQSPGNINAGLNAAMLMRYNQEPEKALARYAQLRGRFPRSREVYLAEIDLLTLQGMQDTVRARYREFLRNSPADAIMYRGLGKSFERKKLYDSARAVYHEMIQKDVDRDAQILAAECFVKEKRTQEAIDTYKMYIASGGKNSEAYYGIIAQLEIADLPDEAKMFALKARALFPEETGYPLTLAKLYLQQNLPDSSWYYIRLIQDEYATHPAISYITSRLYEYSGDTSRIIFHAARTIRTSLELSQVLQGQMFSSISGNNALNSDSLSVANEKQTEIDTLLSVLQNSFALAKLYTTSEGYIALLNRLITDVPQAYRLYLQRAIMYENTNRAAEAERDYLQAIAMAPNSDEIQFAAGLFFEKCGKYDKALNAYRIATGLKNNDEYYSKVVQMAEKNGTLSEICDYWLKKFSTNNGNKVLKSHLIEALHKSGRIKEANEVINTKD